MAWSSVRPSAGPFAVFLGRQRRAIRKAGRGAPATARARRCPRGRTGPGRYSPARDRGRHPGRRRARSAPSSSSSRPGWVPRIISPAPGIGPSRDWVEPGVTPWSQGGGLRRLDRRCLGPSRRGTLEKDREHQTSTPMPAESAASPCFTLLDRTRSDLAPIPIRFEPSGTRGSTLPCWSLLMDLSARPKVRDESSLPRHPRLCVLIPGIEQYRQSRKDRTRHLTSGRVLESRNCRGAQSARKAGGICRDRSLRCKLDAAGSGHDSRP